MNNYTLYFHINNKTGQVFYVGIGKPSRPKCRRGRNRFWKHVVDKYGYDIIIEESELTLDQANILEKYWINRIGRRDLGLGPLVNLTDGGDGMSGYQHKPETIERIRSSCKGKSAWNKGIKDKEETKAKKSKSLMGNTNSPKVWSESRRLKYLIKFNKI